jgi:hypothetical protein
MLPDWIAPLHLEREVSDEFGEVRPLSISVHTPQLLVVPSPHPISIMRVDKSNHLVF